MITGPCGRLVTCGCDPRHSHEWRLRFTKDSLIEASEVHSIARPNPTTPHAATPAAGRAYAPRTRLLTLNPCMIMAGAMICAVHVLAQELHLLPDIGRSRGHSYRPARDSLVPRESCQVLGATPPGNDSHARRYSTFGHALYARERQGR